MARMPSVCSQRTSSVSKAVISDADQQRKVKQQIQGDGRAQHFGQIAGDDGDFAKEPERDVDRRGDRFRGRPGPDRGR